MAEFKLIVAGSRGFNNYELLCEKINQYALGDLAKHDVSIVTGMARGADMLAHRFAKENNVLCHEFPADWDRLGKGAGHIRNAEMGRFADGLLAFWDGKSPGTTHMIQFMTNQAKHIRVIKY